MNLLPFQKSEEIHDSEVTDNDVLAGKGNGVANRPGNMFYTRVIKNHQEAYKCGLNAKIKKAVAQKVLDIIKGQEPEGRFLKPKPGESFKWVIQSESFAMKKITQALREKPKSKAASKTAANEGDNRDSIKKRTIDNRSKMRIIPKEIGILTEEQQNNKELSGKTPMRENSNYRSSKKQTADERKHKWIESESHLKLINLSLKSIDGNQSITDLNPKDVIEAMEAISGTFDNPPIDRNSMSSQDLRKSMQQIAGRLDPEEIKRAMAMEPDDQKRVSLTEMENLYMSMKSLSTAGSGEELNLKEELLRISGRLNPEEVKRATLEEQQEAAAAAKTTVEDNSKEDTFFRDQLLQLAGSENILNQSLANLDISGRTLNVDSSTKTLTAEEDTKAVPI